MSTVSYGQACEVLKETPGRSQPPPLRDHVLWFTRDALNVWYKELDLRGSLPSLPPGLPPFPVTVLGRFAADYFTHTHIVSESPWQTASGDTVPDPLGDTLHVWLDPVRPRTAPPGPWQPVAEAEAYTTAGYDIFAKYRYRIELDSYLDKLEDARDSALAATLGAKYAKMELGQG